MTRTEFEDFQTWCSTIGQTLKEFLLREGISYSTYTYWRRKYEREPDPLPLAPIRITEATSSDSDNRYSATGLTGVVPLFHNGVCVHFWTGIEKILMDILTKRVGHVLP